MRLSNNSIAQIVKLLQLAILTGTDISDNMKQLRFVDTDGVLDLDPDYTETFEENLKGLVEEAQSGN